MACIGSWTKLGFLERLAFQEARPLVEAVCSSLLDTHAGKSCKEPHPWDQVSACMSITEAGQYCPSCKIVHAFDEFQGSAAGTGYFHSPL